MNLETLRNNHEKILNPGITDSSGLNDFQKLPDENARVIQRVGIERFRLPLQFKHSDGTVMSHDAQASMFIVLKEGKTGVNMSRFCAILQEEANKGPIEAQSIKNILIRFKKDLRDYDSEELITDSYLELKLNYPVKQKSLKSDNWGWQYYALEISSHMNSAEEVIVEQKLKYEYSSTCPCSLSMSKQYEKDFELGLTTEGNGIAVAHGQRSIAHCTLTFKLENYINVESTIEMLRQALPTETQSLVKRVDEQAFAILNGDHPMFVEHASRRLALIFDNNPGLMDWKAKIEHLESLHSHNAVAYISKF